MNTKTTITCLTTALIVSACAVPMDDEPLDDEIVGQASSELQRRRLKP